MFITYHGSKEYLNYIKDVVDFLLEQESLGRKYTCVQNAGIISWDKGDYRIVGLPYRTKTGKVVVRIQRQENGNE